mmetsp:Transcript_22750/g.36370  ORF Transcript_22750/g.36370 Transcript_22750/m.36370 type:complete len:272 (-) Transcript_22750:192-1007(-)|eukprot:CAMPEP_0197056696 /NCGR_PEP_ID=MMETSP1384-20130603/88799_1 /TAXON_ID=29189 /ORGANISM="Ammonia sp." /LENGTH=271 /DNA_ID=CAMNT_0042490807 /DNA_START=45 /DNA_END=860 /DNA_ORIENTATION=+
MSATDNLLSDDGNKHATNGFNQLQVIDDEKTRSSYKNLMDDDDDLVIESDDEEETDTLNLAGQTLTVLPPSVCKNKSSGVSTLILTKNKLTSLKGLEHFQSLTTLQLDRNGLKNINDFPKLPQLKTLWLNNNKLRNLNSLLMILKKQCPNLEYLSLLFNPLCPTLDPSTDQLHKRYRLTVIYHLPNVTFLDTEQVQLKERQEASKRGKFLNVAKPSDEQLKDLEDVNEDEYHNDDVSPYKNVKPAAFLGKGRIKYDGRESEGNRFIVNQDL